MSKQKLLQKIQAVSMAVMNIEKDMTVGTGSYQYKAVSDTQVTLAVKKAEKEHGIISIPRDQELISHEVIKTVKTDKHNGTYESISYVDNVKMTVTIYDLETGESIDIVSFGKGIDSGDKGLGKASTYARKYALLNAYKIATGEDPDAEKSQEQSAKPEISEMRVIVTNHLNADVERAIKASEHFGVKSIDDLSEDQIKTMYYGYKKKGLI